MFLDVSAILEILNGCVMALFKVFLCVQGCSDEGTNDGFCKIDTFLGFYLFFFSEFKVVQKPHNFLGLF